MKTSSIILLFVSFLEGGALMATELISAKLAAPFYGTSLYVWAAVFSVTLGGLAFGYKIGGKLSETKSTVSFLRAVLLSGVILTFIMPFLGRFIMSVTLELPILLGILLSCIVFLMPSLICFGVVSPIIIQLLNDVSDNPGKNSSLVYTISTFGGVVCTFSFGFYCIPFLGLTTSLLIVSSFMLLATILTLIIKKNV